MKEYKIDLSMYEGKVLDVVGRAVGNHCNLLAFGHSEKSEAPFPWKYVYVKLKHIEKMREGFRHNFERKPGTLISAADFLAITPEDVKENPVPEFKPFDRVLVRDKNDNTWRIDLFESFSEDSTCRFYCLQNCWKQCIPYEGNEHLLGTKESL